MANGLRKMDKELNEIIKRLEHLENQNEQAEVAAVMEGQNGVLREAKFAALFSLVHELAAREGVSQEQFVKHFEERVRFYRDYYLRIAENINPNWAGQIDVRGLTEMPDSESYSPLFPESKEE